MIRPYWTLRGFIKHKMKWAFGGVAMVWFWLLTSHTGMVGLNDVSSFLNQHLPNVSLRGSRWSLKYLGSCCPSSSGCCGVLIQVTQCDCWFTPIVSPTTTILKHNNADKAFQASSVTVSCSRNYVPSTHGSRASEFKRDCSQIVQDMLGWC